MPQGPAKLAKTLVQGLSKCANLLGGVGARMRSMLTQTTTERAGRRLSPKIEPSRAGMWPLSAASIAATGAAAASGLHQDAVAGQPYIGQLCGSNDPVAEDIPGQQLGVESG